MDTTAGITATQKVLDSLKSVPTWLLVSVCISASSIWLWPTLFTLVPEPLRWALPIVTLVAGILTIGKVISLGFVHLLERRRGSLAQDRERLVHVYRPLASLFLTRHVTTCTGRGAPYLRHRLENARAEFGIYRRRTVGLKRAWRALFDRQVSSSAEIEFGGDFPLSQVIGLVKRKARHADLELLRLVNRADRSRYEEPDPGLMTDAELALFEHVDREHRRLSQRVG